ncbi:hypothetical protein [Phyllobacterium leguminum]|uniref:Uncharacterized protein n=1 Tax=Phyllobacterium leguminum TaxID=314237 RepID=A0A318T8E5_9HYPH|nr:hypothetical protein [Phyllobacterium leguminum]PYE86885.1 hypothetical protein C7477_11823 [Phyllobacterium leguminum]
MVRQPNTFELSDRLKHLEQIFARFEEKGVNVSPRGVDALMRTLKEFRETAMALENEVSRHRWNDAARRERAQRQRQLLADAVGTGDVMLFPVISRPEPKEHVNAVPGGDRPRS